MTKPMPTILIAPDSFKGSLSNIEFCQLAQEAIQQVIPDAQCLLHPLSDGGEGFVETLLHFSSLQSHSEWQAVTTETTDPLQRPIQATYAWNPAEKTAVVEMAQASGLPLLSRDELNPLKATTFGTGKLIQHAIEHGAEKIILGLGGSATNDGGAGALQALGVGLLDKEENAIPLGGAGLLQLKRIGTIPEHLLHIEWVLAADVTNPLLGPKGATAVFGSQKGVTPENAEQLEAGLGILAKAVEKKTGKQMANLTGGGAAGGFGATWMGLLDAQYRSGFEVLTELTHWQKTLDESDIDLIITAEGQIDEQTAHGKLPARVAASAQRRQIPCWGVCGQLKTDTLAHFDLLIDIHQQAGSQNETLEQKISATPQRLQTVIQKKVKEHFKQD